MNQHPGLTTAIAIALAVIITAGGMSLVGSFVLCVGSDGHADLELALGVCCSDDEEPRDETGGDSTPSLGDSCGSCADIGLDASSLIKGKQQLTPPQFAVIDIAGQFDICTVPRVDPHRGEGTDPSHLKDLLSVVRLT